MSESQSDSNQSTGSAEQVTLTEAISPSRKDGTLSPGQWARVAERRKEMDNYTCVNCGNAERQVTVHHIVPDTHGGTIVMGNLRSLCDECHKKTHIKETVANWNAVRSVDAPYIPMVQTLKDIIEPIAHPLHRVVWLLLAKTGIRVDEFVGLDMDQLSLHRNPLGYTGIGPRPLRQPDHITVFQKNTEGVAGARGARIVDMKIPLDRELSKAIRDYLTIRPDPSPTLDGSPVFLGTTSKYGEPLTSQSIHHIVEKWARKAGHYKTGAGQKENVTPITLSHFFDERFEGQPSTRDYILGRRDNMPFAFKRMVTDYREGVPNLLG